MLALNYPGGWNDVKGSTAVTVLQFLMGGGGSFSAGGPGQALRLSLAERKLACENISGASGCEEEPLPPSFLDPVWPLTHRRALYCMAGHFKRLKALGLRPGD